jgi:hypothetical protein
MQGPSAFESFQQGAQARQQNQFDRMRQEALREKQAMERSQFEAWARGEGQKEQQRLSEQAFRTLQWASQPGVDTRAVIKQAFPDKAREFNVDALSDDQLKQGVAQMLAQFGPMAGQSPQVKFQDVKGPGGSLLQRNPLTNELSSVVGREPAIPASITLQPNFIPLTPDEVKAAGLPPGTAAQRDTTSGKIDVLTKRDTTGSLSQKDMVTAKQKLNTVKLARQQLNNIKNRFQSLKGTMSAGAFGQGKVPSEKGRAFDRSVDQMRSTLTALTRVPGVGAMSDYETRLDQSKFPTRDEYESVTEQQIGDLEAMLNAIETGYTDLLSGAPITPEAPAQSAPQSGGWTIEEVR